MPELPEVETIVRRLADVLPGRTVDSARVPRENIVFGRSAAAFAREVTGATVESVSRRAKFIVIRLTDGRVWLTHLRMSGRYQFVPAGREVREPAYTRAVFHLRGGGTLLYVDVRTLGGMELVRAGEWAERAAALGPEPLEEGFTPGVLRERLGATRRAVKVALLDQAVVAGLGNIYVCEALWRARVSPRRRGVNVGPERARRLHRAIVDVLAEAVGKQGTSLGATYLNWADSEGERGRFYDFLDVYDREGEPCRRCGSAIRRIVQAQRSTWYCPGCQR